MSARDGSSADGSSAHASSDTAAGPEPAEFAAPPHDFVADLVGDPIGADLRVLFAGNQFMALPETFRRFAAGRRPRPSVFYETLPPGIMVRQLRRGGLRMGSLVLRFTPDVIAAGPSALDELREEGLVGPARRYASNGLALMVAAGNPLDVRGWSDLTRPEVRTAFPDPETEGIGRLAQEAIRVTGGDSLLEEIFGTARERGSLRLTSIHHRQGLAWLEDGSTDVAVVWQTEVAHHRAAGRPVQEVVIPPGHNRVGQYAVAEVTAAPHPELAEAFVDFLCGPDGRAVFAEHGFAAPE